MPLYHVRWTEIASNKADGYVEAESVEEAIKKAQKGECEEEDSVFEHAEELKNFSAAVVEEIGEIAEEYFRA